MNLRFLTSTAHELFEDSAERSHFIDIFQAPPVFANAIAWIKPRTSLGEVKLLARPAWLHQNIDLIAPIDTMTESHLCISLGKSEHYRQGYYYILDITSSISATVIDRAYDFTQDGTHGSDHKAGSSLVVADVCASPGGKSCVAYSVLRPKLLIANEVVPKRLSAIISNFIRCNISPALISNNSPEDFAEALRNLCEIVLVDAPCSGQSLLLKGQENPGCFNPQVINMNAKRQRYILAQAGQMVSSDGFLIYSTCTFSKKENEDVIEWFLRTNSSFVPVDVPHLAQFRSKLSSSPCYRIYPGETTGAGGFIALLTHSQNQTSPTVSSQLAIEKATEKLRIVRQISKNPAR